MQAYAISDADNVGGIVFATHPVVAMIRGAHLYCDDDIGSISCTRAKWADCYAAQGDVPAAAMVEQGWNLECIECGEKIGNHLAFERDGWSPADVTGFQNGRVFCSTECSEQAQKNRAKERVGVDLYR